MFGLRTLKNRELRAVVKMAEKLGTTDMFYTNIQTCVYTMPKSPQRKAVYMLYIDTEQYILTYQTKYTHTYVYYLVIVSHLLSLPAHVEKASTRAQNYSTC